MEVEGLLNVAIFIIVCAVVFFTLKGQDKARYDERQEMIRNRGFKYGFYTMLGVLGCYLFLNTTDIKISATILAWGVGVIGALVACLYQILNGAYFSLTEKHPVLFGILFLIVGGANLATTIQQFSMHLSVEDIVPSCGSAVFLVLLGGAILYRQYRDRAESDK